MKPLFTRDIPPRAAAVVVALALLASVVTGREETSSGTQPVKAQEPAPVREMPQAPQAPQTAGAKETNLPDLDLEKLNRPRKEKKIANLFATKSWMPAPQAAAALAAAASLPPPAPTAPPLPFRYLGKLIDGQKTSVFLGRNEEYYSVSVGDTVDGSYQIESIDETAVNFIYTPLGSKQALPITTSPN